MCTHSKASHLSLKEPGRPSHEHAQALGYLSSEQAALGKHPM